MKKRATSKAVFLDKDGTLIPDIPYNADPDLITISGEAIEGLKLLSRLGYRLVVISNQSGVARGYFREQQLEGVFEKITSLLSSEQIVIDRFYYCPHHPEGTIKEYSVECDCRKPLPGMILRAARELDLDLDRSWMIGDILNDVEAGNRAGCKTILIDNGNETEWALSSERQPVFKARSMNDASRYILEQCNCVQHEQELAGL